MARLKKRDLKKPNKTPRNYDQTPFTLDGGIDLDITFEGRTMSTPVYIKSDAHKQLLLSGVSRQLGILQYHSAVEPWIGRRKQNQSQASTSVPSPLKKNTSDVPKDLSCIYLPTTSDSVSYTDSQCTHSQGSGSTVPAVVASSGSLIQSPVGASQ